MPGVNAVLVARGSAVLAVNPDKLSAAPEAFTRPLAMSTHSTVIRVSADSSHAAQFVRTSPSEVCARSCAALVVYDVQNRNYVLGPLPMPFPEGDVAISDNGDLVAVADTGGSGRVISWDVSRRRRVGRVPVAGSAVAFGVGDLLYVGSAGRARPRGHGPTAAGAPDVRRA